MIRVVCSLALISTVADCVLAAGGERAGVFSDEYRWIYWVFAASLLFTALRVLVKGTE